MAFVQAADNIDGKNNFCQNSMSRMKCPKELDVAKLKSLTADVGQQEIFQFILQTYDEVESSNDSELENNKQKPQFILRENLSNEVLEKLIDSFEVIGYFEITSVLKGKALSMFRTDS